MHLEISSAKWRPFCLGGDELRYGPACPSTCASICPSVQSVKCVGDTKNTVSWIISFLDTRYIATYLQCRPYGKQSPHLVHYVHNDAVFHWQPTGICCHLDTALIFALVSKWIIRSWYILQHFECWYSFWCVSFFFKLEHYSCNWWWELYFIVFFPNDIMKQPFEIWESKHE